MKCIVGIDPGLASLGWGVLSLDDNTSSAAIEYRAHGVINTPSDHDLPSRLFTIEQKFDALLSRYSPHALAYEQQFFVRNVTSGLEVAYALGVILLYCAKQNLPIVGYTPTKIKKQITGSAKASKESIEKFICHQLGIDKITPHHASDALATALVLCYAFQQNPLFLHQSQTSQNESKFALK